MAKKKAPAKRGPKPGGERLSGKKIYDYWTTLTGGDDENKAIQASKRFNVEPRRVAMVILLTEGRNRFPGIFKRAARGGGEPSRGFQEILKALNKGGTLSEGAKLLEISPITLAKWVAHFKLNCSTTYGEEGKEIVWSK